MKPLRVIAIEDDEVDLMSVKRAFSELRLVNPIEHAIDGVAALELLSKLTPSTDEGPIIILLDLNMPRMNGFEFLKAFMALENRPDCKIFVLTTSDTDQDILDAYKFEISGYILKTDIVDSLKEGLSSLEQNWMLVG